MLGKTKNKYKYILFAMVFVGCFLVMKNVSIALTFEEAMAIEGTQGTQPVIQKSVEELSKDYAKNPNDYVNLGAHNSTGTAGPTLNWILHPVASMLYSVFVFVGWLVSLSSTMLGWVLSPVLWGKDGFLEKEVVYQAWGTIRDLFNMLFILMLLFSAFATIFQVDKFNIKKIFLSTLLAVLLINFSFPITRVIIDISNVMMFSFLNGTSGLNIVADFAGYTNVGSELMKPGNYASYPIPYMIASIIFVFILAITFLVLAIMLMIRLIELMGLIMFSPIGFIGSIFPGISGLSGKWWDALFRNAFFGPFMALTLMFANNIMASKEGEAKNPLLEMATRNAPAGNGDHFAIWLAQAAYYAVPIVILWLGMGIAKSMSITGAGAVVGAGEKFAKWTGSMLTTKPAGLAWKGAGVGAKWFDRNVLGPKFSPRAIIAGWEAKTKDAENKHLSVGTGLWHDNFNSLFRSGKTNYRMLAEHQIVSKRQKELAEVSEESEVLLKQAGDLLGKKTKTAQTDLQAIFRILINNNDHDELMDWVRNNIQEDNDVGKQLKSMGFNENNWNVSAGNTANAVDILLKNSGMDEGHINQHLIDLGNIAANKGGIMFGASGVDKNGKYIRNFTVDKDGKVDDSVMGDYAARKIMTTPDSQNVPKTMHRNHFTDQAEGAANLNEHGKAMLRHYASPSAVEMINRHKPDFFKRVGGDKDITRQMFNYAKVMQEEYVGPGGKKEKANPEQAMHAATYTAALMARSGASKDDIERQLTEAKFSSDEIKEIFKRAGQKGTDLKEEKEGKEKKKGKKGKK